MTRPSIEDGRVAAALDAAGLGEFEWDVASDTLVISRRLAGLTGLPEGPMPARRGQALLELVAPDQRASVAATLADRLGGDRITLRFAIQRRGEDRLQWLEASAGLVRGEGGRPVSAAGVVRDVSELKGEEDAREALVYELDHRVKNVLASVNSLAAQSARRTVSLDAFLKTFHGRVDAMAAAHTLLMATRWRGAEIGNIAAAELAGLAQGRARWEGPEMLLNARATNALTLALHELGTNAVKFGALSVESGRVDVRWKRLTSGGFELVWTETQGPAVPPPSHQGFGRTLLERVTGRELGGTATLDFPREGVRAVLIADFSALAASEGDVAAQKAPAFAAEPPSEQAGASAGSPGGDDVRGVRVLIVEDAVLLAIELEAGLTEAGAKVVGVAADLDEAQRLSKLDFDVAVLDANLNGRSVMPVARALAERGTPFIFATGYGDAGAAPEGFSAPVVRKPYNVHQIAAALVEALEARRTPA
ncbi:MAG TPA: HWE histidine kinase domain-containing protein [Caulobacteraceae bacterium]|jgi:two-component sensor histidine kinase|nr:HWE histidine kinase domain-containing protein [Caulobacteraceae bacterium]